MGTLIRAANLTGFEELILQLGGNPAELLSAFNIDPSHFRDPYAYVPFKSLSLLLENAAYRYHCPDFGLRLAQWQGLNMLGPLAVMARNANTVLDAFRSLERYLHFHGPALKLSFLGNNKAGDFCFGYRIEEPGLTQLSQAYELSLANGTYILRLLAGSAARPTQVYLPHAPLSSRAAYTSTFGCPVEFEASGSGISFRASDMLKPLESVDAEARLLAQRYLDSFEQLSNRIDLRVTELIHALMATGQCSLDAIADQMAMHPRTLQRALEEFGTSYDTLLNQFRREKLQHYLLLTGMGLSQVAALLGYNDQSSMNRACKRWFGCTPRQLRQSLKARGIPS